MLFAVPHEMASVDNLLGLGTSQDLGAAVARPADIG